MDSTTLALAAASLGISVQMLIILFAWSLVWKALALWKSARLGSKVWFVVLFIVNTVGILEILYIYVFSGMRRRKARRR